MTKDEALRLALNALEAHADIGIKADKAITAIKDALEAKDEPVAWRTFDGEGGYDYRTYENNEDYANDWDKRNPNHKGWVEPLYTTPPQRTWVGLTNDELTDLFYNTNLGQESAVGQAIALLKERNT